MDPVPVCTVCIEPFCSATENRRPHSLPCGHCLCYRCLGRLLQSSASTKKECPKCRKPLGTTDLSEVPRSFDLADMIESYRQQQQQQIQEAVLRSAISPDDLQLTCDIIGWGAAGVVRRGVLTVRNSLMRVAVKVLSTHDSTPAEAASAEQEIKSKAYAAQTCSRIVRVFAHCTKDQQVCLIMLPWGDSLVSLVEGGMSQQQKMQAAWQLLKAVQRLHERHMLNLNIHPRTVQLDDFGDVVLSGPSTLHQMPAGSQSLPSSRGTDNLRCPEVTQLNGTSSQKSADVRSLACTILYIFTQEWPVEDMPSIQTYDALQAGQVPAIPHSLPLDLQRMLRQCFTWPHTRSTAALMALKLQAMMEDTSCYQAGDKTSGMPFSADAISHQPNPALMTGGLTGQSAAAVAKSVLQLQPNGRLYASQEKAATNIGQLASESQENRNAITAAGAMPLLVTLLRSDQAAVQAPAAQALANLVYGSQYNQKAMIAVGSVPILIELLRSDQPDVQRAAAAALYTLAFGCQETRDAITAAGALPLLVTLLKSDQPAVQVPAATALAKFANSSQLNQDAIISAGSAPLLVELLKSDQPTVQEAAATALYHLASGSRENCDAFTVAGALPLLVTLLRSDQPAVQAPAVSTLANIAYCSQHNQDAIVSAGAAPLLVELLRSDQPAMQKRAASALGHLVIGSQQNRDAIVVAGAVPLLVMLLRSNQPAVQTIAAAALGHFASGSQQNQDAVIAAGSAPLLTELLRSDHPAMQEAAAAALSRLACGSQQNCDAITVAGALPLLATLLRSDQPTILTLAACALGNVAHRSQHKQEAIIAAGSAPLLVELLRSHQPAVRQAAAVALFRLASGSQENRDSINVTIARAGALPLLVTMCSLFPQQDRSGDFCDIMDCADFMKHLTVLP